MLMATPNKCDVDVDRKPRVISEVRKSHLRRSPVLDGHPRISGILLHHNTVDDVWSARWVAVREGALLVHPEERDPLQRGCSTLGPPLSPLSHSSLPLHRLPLRHLNLRPCRFTVNAFTLSRRGDDEEALSVAQFQAASRRDYERWVKTLAVEILRQTPLDAVRFLDVLGIAAFDDYLNTPPGTGTSFNVRAPANPLQLTSSSKSTCRGRQRYKQRFTEDLYRYRGQKDFDETATQALRYDNTAMEVATTLKSPRHAGEKTKQASGRSKDAYRDYFRKQRSKDTTNSPRKTEINYFIPVPPSKYSHERKAKSNPFDDPELTYHDERYLLNGVIITDRILRADSYPTLCIERAFSTQALMKSKTAILSIDTKNSPTESQAPDEGIVVEDYDYDDSSSENSFVKVDEKMRLELKNSISLDRHKSMTNHPSYNEPNGKPDIRSIEIHPRVSHDFDTVDSRVVESMHSLNRRPPCIRLSSEQETLNFSSSRSFNNCETCSEMSNSNNFNRGKSAVRISRIKGDTEASKQAGPISWLGTTLKPAGIDQLIAKDIGDEGKTRSKSSSSLDTEHHGLFVKKAGARKHSNDRWSWEMNNIKNKSLSAEGNQLYARARSISPSVQRRVASCTRISQIQEEPGLDDVVALRLRCQDTNQYVPVREKLALFETLSQMGHRLARSSEDLVVRRFANGADRKIDYNKRASSLHDLSGARNPAVPVKEICMYFEKISNECNKYAGEENRIDRSRSVDPSMGNKLSSSWTIGSEQYAAFDGMHTHTKSLDRIKVKALPREGQLSLAGKEQSDMLNKFKYLDSQRIVPHTDTFTDV